MDRSQPWSRKMAHERKSTLLYDQDYYGPLIDSYVKSILKSGLLLDEDLEVLLSIFKVRNGCKKNSYKPSLYLLGSICVMLGSSVLAKKYNLPVIALPSVVVVVKVVYSELKTVITRKNDSKIIDRLIEAINAIQKLTLDIIRYLKIRDNLENTNNAEFFTLHTKSMEDFFRAFLRSKLNFSQDLMESLMKISKFCSELLDDFKGLEDLNVQNIITGDIDDVTPNDYVEVTGIILDLHVLLTSKILSYIGITFYSTTSRLNAENATLFINKLLPSILSILQHHLEDGRKQFNSIRCTTNRISEYTLTKSGGNKQFLTLQKTFSCSVNNLSIILEKSLTALDRMENSNGNDLKEIATSLENLRNHTYVTYESLDLLCKLYGIISNCNTSSQKTAKIVNEPEKNSSLNDLPVVNYDDRAEPVEEKYELYLRDDDNSHTLENPTNTYDDQSGAYISLLVEELKQSLKQHYRFIDQKNRRGSVDEDDVIHRKDDVSAAAESVPKFNLSVLKHESNQEFTPVPPPLPNLDERAVKTINLPVPPPPPLPSFNLNDLEEETGPLNARSMLDNIRALANQRCADELVIGDCDSDTDTLE